MGRFIKKLYGDSFVNTLIADLEGQRYNRRPFEFVDNDGNCYTHIAGAIAMPTFEHAGYLIVMGVVGDCEKIDCLEEFESENEIELIQKAMNLQADYGDNVISMWWGNPTALMPIVADINDDKKPVLISFPADHDKDDAFQLYVSRIQTSMLRGKNKILWFNDCNIFQNHMRALVKDKSERAKNNPVITAAGSLIHTLLVLRPWEQAIEKIELIPTREGEMAAYGREQEEKLLMQELFGVAV